MSGDRVVVGLHPVRELLRAGRAVRSLSISERRGTSPVLDEILDLAARAGVSVAHVDAHALDARAHGLVHQGVVADAPAFPLASVTELIARSIATTDRPLLVALDGVTDPHNLGSIARTAEALGAQGMLIPDRRAAGITPTVEKAAAGALAHLPVARVTNLVRALDELGDAGIWSIGLDADAPVELTTSHLVSEPCVLVVGAESTGLRRLTRERCDVLARLRMRGRVDSLNASVAAGIALHVLAQSR
ncbi:MAG: 23S rRNA (guanosine(2251)-2'-O)-methyltransferase RlmB [Nitriliruptoraceae bacterium]